MANNVRPYPLSDVDVAVIFCALDLMQGLLFKSRYPSEIQAAISAYIVRLIANLTQVCTEPLVVDDYQNNHSEET